MRKKVLLVGASTGGPAQIKDMLSSIETLSCTVLIAQHMREEVLPFFIKDLQDSLSLIILSTPLTTNFSEPSVIICAHTSILKKESFLYEIINNTQGQYYTPDINILFNSFANFAHEFELEVLIMTGIGSDGIEGAKVLKSKGARIFAQDEASSPVYGMPRVALESGIVDEVKSLDAIKECFRVL